MFSSSGGGTNAIGTFNFGQDSSFNNAETDPQQIQIRMVMDNLNMQFPQMH